MPTSYPGVIDTTVTLYDAASGGTILPEHHDVLVEAVMALETKLGAGAAPASVADDGAFMVKDGASTIWRRIEAEDLNGVNGSGLVGIGTGTGGVINTGSTTIGADSDANGVGVVVLQTRNITRLQVNNDGTLLASGVKLKLGDNTITDGSRVELTTQSANVIAFGATTFNFDNGPTGDLDYKDNTWGISYNSGTNGVKLVAGEVNFSLNHEPKYRNGVRGVGVSNFQTEIYYSWTNPGGGTTIRPWGFDVRHSDSSVTQSIQGEIYFKRNVGNGGGVWAIWSDNGALDLSNAPVGGGVFAFRNNSDGIIWRNAAGDNTITAIKINASDELLIATSGSFTRLQGVTFCGDFRAKTLRISADDAETDNYFQALGFDEVQYVSSGSALVKFEPAGLRMFNHIFFHADNTKDIGMTNFTNFRPRNIYAGTDVIIGGVFRVGANQVVGARGAAVADATDNASAILRLNDLLARVRAHGLIS